MGLIECLCFSQVQSFDVGHHNDTASIDTSYSPLLWQLPLATKLPPLDLYLGEQRMHSISCYYYGDWGLPTSVTIDR